MIFRRLLGVALTILAARAACSEPTLIVAADRRTSVSLNGAWRAIVDPFDGGYLNYRGAPRDDGYFRNAKPRTKDDLVEYDFDSSAPLQVPGDWNTQRESLLFYEGTVWYEKDFDYARKPETRVFFHVGAANDMARVYVNGERACEHEGGFTPFDCEVTELVRDGRNFAVVSVNNQRRRDGVPALSVDWWNDGGLTRDVALIEVPHTFIDDYFLRLAAGSSSTVAGWVHADGAPAGQSVTVAIPELGVQQEFRLDYTGSARVRMRVPGLALWSPETPKLYDVEIRSGSDTVRDAIGFRTIEVRGRDILLNGRPVFLRGVSLHAEAPRRPGRAWSDEDARTLLGWAKDLGANFVRLAHYPHDERMTRLADKLGLMVWSEIPVYWAIAWDNPSTLERARGQLSEMIRRDRNKASVILWSVANETPPSPARLRFLRSLIATARAEDPTRLITAALEVRVEGEERIIDDPLGAELDVPGCNEYIGWYEGRPEDADRARWRMAYEKPLIVSEFGGDARFGRHGAADERWTEEYQENLYRHQLAMLRKIPFLRGMSPWVLADFRSPRRPLPLLQDFYNRKGLLSEKGEKKKAYFVLRDFYRGLESSR